MGTFSPFTRVVCLVWCLVCVGVPGCFSRNVALGQPLFLRIFEFRLAPFNFPAKSSFSSESVLVLPPLSTVFVRPDAHWLPFHAPYDGLFQLLKAGVKSFVLNMVGRRSISHWMELSWHIFWLGGCIADPVPPWGPSSFQESGYPIWCFMFWFTTCCRLGYPACGPSAVVNGSLWQVNQAPCQGMIFGSGISLVGVGGVWWTLGAYFSPRWILGVG